MFTACIVAAPSAGETLHRGHVRSGGGSTGVVRECRPQRQERPEFESWLHISLCGASPVFTFLTYKRGNVNIHSARLLLC